MAEDIMVADSLDHTAEVLDEVLQHTSAQALRISHVDESLVEIRAQVSELRAVVVSNAQAAPAESTNHQLDHLENETKALKSRLAIVTAFSFLQLGALGALLFFALKPAPPPPPVVIEAPKPPTPAAPAPEVTNSENLLKPPAPPPEKPAEPAKPAPIKKKKK